MKISPRLISLTMHHAASFVFLACFFGIFRFLMPASSIVSSFFGQISVSRHPTSLLLSFFAVFISFSLCHPDFLLSSPRCVASNLTSLLSLFSLTSHLFSLQLPSQSLPSAVVLSLVPPSLLSSLFSLLFLFSSLLFLSEAEEAVTLSMATPNRKEKR